MTLKLKKTIYIISFIILGILLQFLIHAFVETWYIDRLIGDFPTYSFGFSWENWYLIHHTLSVILFIGGVLFGFWQGKFWWHKIYEENIRNLKF